MDELPQQSNGCHNEIETSKLNKELREASSNDVANTAAIVSEHDSDQQKDNTNENSVVDKIDSVPAADCAPQFSTREALIEAETTSSPALEAAGNEDRQAPVSSEFESDCVPAAELSNEELSVADTAAKSADSMSSVVVIDTCEPNNQSGASDPPVETQESDNIDSESGLVLNINESSNLDCSGGDCADAMKSAEIAEADKTGELERVENADSKQADQEKVPPISLPEGSPNKTDKPYSDADNNSDKKLSDPAETNAELPSTEQNDDSSECTKGNKPEDNQKDTKEDSTTSAKQIQDKKISDSAAAKEPSTVSKLPPPIRARPPAPGTSQMIDLTLSDDEADGNGSTRASNSRKRPPAVISGAMTSLTESSVDNSSTNAAAPVSASTDRTSSITADGRQDDSESSAKRSRSDPSIVQSLDAVLESASQEGRIYVPPFTLPALSEVTSMVSNRLFRLERDVKFLTEKIDRQQTKMRTLLTINRRLDAEIRIQKGGQMGPQSVGATAGVSVAAQSAVHNATPAAVPAASAAHHHQHLAQHQQQQPPAVVMLQAPVHQHQHQVQQQQQQQQYQQLRLNHQPSAQQTLPTGLSNNRSPAASQRQLSSGNAITIDLTSEDEPQSAGGSLVGAERRKSRSNAASAASRERSLPAPLPVTPAPVSAVSTSKLPPSRATLTLERTPEGVTLQWDLADVSHLHAGVKAYEIWSYSETLDDRHPRRRQPPSCPWAKVGDVKALPLPMSCSLTQIEPGSMFHFAVRALDVYNRFGRWSNVCSVPVPNTPVRALPSSNSVRTGSQQQMVGTVLRA